MERTLTSFRMPNDLMENLRQRAKQEGVSVTELVCRFSRSGLQAEGSNPASPADIDTEVRLARLEERVKHLSRLEARVDEFMFDLVGTGIRRQLQTRP